MEQQQFSGKSLRKVNREEVGTGIRGWGHCHCISLQTQLYLEAAGLQKQFKLKIYHSLLERFTRILSKLPLSLPSKSKLLLQISLFLISIS